MRNKERTTDYEEQKRKATRGGPAEVIPAQEKDTMTRVPKMAGASNMVIQSLLQGKI